MIWKGRELQMADALGLAGCFVEGGGMLAGALREAGHGYPFEKVRGGYVRCLAPPFEMVSWSPKPELLLEDPWRQNLGRDDEPAL